MTQICALYTVHGKRAKIAYAYYDASSDDIHIVIKKQGVVVGSATIRDLNL